MWADVLAAQSSSSMANPRVPTNELDKDAFLLLLITQMKHQDPLSPMDNTQFLSQMAQFTALEQMTNLNRTMNLSQGYSMIGKTVYGQVQDKTTGTSREVFGTVDAVSMRGGIVYLTVGGTEITLDQVQYLGQDIQQAEQLGKILESIGALNNSQNMSLIGKYIQAITMDGETPKEFVEGKVDYIKFNGMVPILMVGEKEVYPSEVLTVADNMMLIGSLISAVVRDAETGEDAVVSGTVSGVRIAPDNAYLMVNGNEIPVSKINYVVDALRLIGGEIRHGEVSGAVESVLIRGGLPYLRILMAGEDGEQEEHLVSFTEYKGII